MSPTSSRFHYDVFRPDKEKLGTQGTPSASELFLAEAVIG